jgi:hypothetical protein
MAYARRFGECLADLEGALRAPEGGAA